MAENKEIWPEEETDYDLRRRIKAKQEAGKSKMKAPKNYSLGLPSHTKKRFCPLDGSLTMAAVSKAGMQRARSKF